MAGLPAVCPLCEAACGLLVELADCRVTGVRGDPDDPMSQGYLCPKATAVGDVMADPDRLRAPRQRQGGSWVERSWAGLTEEVGARLASIQKAHGRSSVAMYLGNPVVHDHGALLGGVLLRKALGTRHAYSATSLDQLPHMRVAYELFGHQLLLPVPDVDRTDHLLVIGANPLVSNGSLATAPDMRRRLRALRERGGRLVVVDPRRSETAAVADQWVAVRPGGDAALLLGMLWTLAEDGALRPGRLAAATEGIEAFTAALRPFSPERVAGAAGVEAETIRQLARSFAAAPSAVCYPRMGACTQAEGGLVAYLAVALNLLTGNLDRAGGAMFGDPPADLVGLGSLLGQGGSAGRYRSAARGLPEVGGELPIVTLAEDIEAGAPIKALICVAGNPVSSAPQGDRLARAIEKLELVVSVDLYCNETSRLAHYILPTAFGFEKPHYDLAFSALALRSGARYAPALVPPPAGLPSDWSLLTGLARGLLRAGGGKGLGARAALEGACALGPDGIVDLMLRLGPRRTSLRAVRAAAHGLDYGPLRERLPARLFTPGRQIRLWSPLWEGALADYAGRIDAPAEPLVLVGRRRLASNNSWLHNVARLRRGPDRCTLIVHPEDADRAGLGARARVESPVDAVEVPVERSVDIRPGVVSLPHGYGQGLPGVQLSVAVAQPGANINHLIEAARVEPISGTAALSGQPVRLLPAP